MRTIDGLFCLALCAGFALALTGEGTGALIALATAGITGIIVIIKE